MVPTKRLSAWSGGVVFCVALSLLAGPGCGDDDKKTPSPVVIPDIGGGPDVGDAGDEVSPDDDADASNPDLPDADTDLDSDADAAIPPDDVDASEDGDDLDVNGPEIGEEVGEEVGVDVPPDVEDPELLTDFTQSCLYPVVSCLTPSRTVQSCTANAVNGTLDVSFGPGLAQRSEERLLDGLVLTAYADGSPCFEALPLDDREEPTAWEIRDLKGAGGSYTVAILEGQARINCASGGGEDFVLGQVEPYLPAIISPEDAGCVSRALPECTQDADCLGAGCCEVADLTRCLADSVCPDIASPSVDLMGCMAPMLSCFGADATPLACFVDAIEGETTMGYTGGRSATFAFEGDGSAMISASQGGSTCWTAAATAEFGLFNRYVFEDTRNGGTYTVTLEPSTSSVLCADGTQLAVDTELLERFIPPVLGEEDRLCELQCGTDADCGDDKCCLVSDGYRCLNTDFCPDLGNPLEESCIGATLSCFGESPEQVSCLDYDYVDLTYVSYRSGSQAAYFSTGDSPHVRTFYPTRDCFEASIGAGSTEVQDLVTGEVFQITFAGPDAQVMCPNSGPETLPAELLRRFLPGRPDGATCDEPVRNDACQLDADCTNALLPVCCDTGTRNRCNSAIGCETARPRQQCDATADCATPGEVCCGRSTVKVCDYGLCGDAICCSESDLQVCDTVEVCGAEDRCDPMDANACGAGTMCCQGFAVDGFDCREANACRDFEPPVCTGDGECAAFGADWRCCANEESVQVCQSTVGGMCPVIGDQCTSDGECTGADEVCCGEVGSRRCVPAAVCGDSCSSNDECPGEGLVCCPDSRTCEQEADCLSRGLCNDDSDCSAGICCKAYKDPVCENASDCPAPCRSEDDCPGTQVCCSSEATVFGPHCSVASECNDVTMRSCTDNGDCGGGQLCCRTMDVPACVAADQCPVACHDNGDCGGGMECCGAGRRTPVCVAGGSCKGEIGESCAVGTDCESGLSCCNYDTLGLTCVPPEFCGQAIPSGPCGDNPGLCNAYPLAVCCRSNLVPTCTRVDNCDASPNRLCTNAEDCGPSGFTCCETSVDPGCRLPSEGVCTATGGCTDDSDCPSSSVCCPLGSGDRCVPAAQCMVDQPRVPCSDANQCVGAEVCCSIGVTQVCDFSLCSGDPCCEIDTTVCATAAECL